MGGLTYASANIIKDVLFCDWISRREVYLMRIDLLANTALPLTLEGTELRFGDDVEPVEPTVCLAGGEMRDAFMRRR